MVTRNLREATSSVHVSYPVPYLATVLLLAGIAVIGLAAAFSGWERGLLIAFAGGFFFVALFAVVWSILARPELLKSERYMLLERMMEGVGDSDMDAAARERLHTRMLKALSERPLQLSQPTKPESDEDSNDA